MAHRISRKDLKQPDEFHTLSWRFIHFLAHHRREVYLYSGIVVAIIVAVLGWYLYGLHYESRAGEMYARAYGSYTIEQSGQQNSESIKKAIDLYEELVKKYPSSEAAILAFYNLGNLYYSAGDMDQSIAAYRSYLEKSDKSSMLRGLAYYGLGYCYETKKDYEKALKSFENSEKNTLGTHFKIINYANTGRIYEKMGNSAKALEYYKKVAGDDVDPFIQGLMKQKIANLS